MLRAQNDGEGGVFALYGLLHDRADRRVRMLLWALMAGAGLLIGDGMITPAISVLSAVEGLGVAVPSFAGAVMPVTLGLLIALFAIQFKGASGVGFVFGPIVLVWFAAIAALGAVADRGPSADSRRLQSRLRVRVSGPRARVRGAPDPRRADAGRHRGRSDVRRRRPFRRAADPAFLVRRGLSGASPELSRPGRLSDRRRRRSPTTSSSSRSRRRWLLMPMVALATAATVIASQALISGAFSLVSQAIRLGLFPRLEIRHTHHAQRGANLHSRRQLDASDRLRALVWSFGSSASLAAAYGLAVSGVMVITSVAMIPVALRQWGWSPAPTALVWGPLTALNGAFLMASSLKLFEGGYVPIAVGGVAFAAMATWRWGRKATYAAHNAKATMTDERGRRAAPVEPPTTSSATRSSCRRGLCARSTTARPR